MVLYSSASEPFLEAMAKSCGASGYIRKGVPTEVLLSKLEALLQQVRRPGA